MTNLAEESALSGLLSFDFGELAEKNLQILPWAVFVISMPDYRYLYLNNAAAEVVRTLTGKDPDEVLGLHLGEIIPNWRDSLLPALEEMLAAGKMRQFTDVKLEQKKRVTYWNITLIPNFDDSHRLSSVSAVCVESTIRRRVTRERQRLATILEATSDFVITIDLAGQILYLNRAAREIFGISEETNLSARTLSTSHPDWAYKITFGEGIPAAVKNGLWSGESTILSHEGREIPVSQVIVAHKASDGHIDYLSMIARDITERKVAEKKHAELEAHKLDFYRRTIQAATKGKLVITERDDVLALAGEARASWEIASPEDLGIVRGHIRELALAEGMEEERMHHFLLVSGEALTNAFKHAGGGFVSIHVLDESLLLVVADEGPGIEALCLPDVALTTGYSTAGTLGMGYKAMLSFADKIYLATCPNGTTIGVSMKFASDEDPIQPHFALDD